MPNYCQRCILPDTRPGVVLDAEGVCAGCRNAEAKRHIDWGERAAHFRHIVEVSRARAGDRNYDCVVPVSGGKDSFWQVVTCLEQGLHPLCVSYICPGLTELGRRNLTALADIGVDLLQLRISPDVERRFVRKSFEKTGIGGLVSHMAIYRWPVHIALTHGIPLVVYGENSAFEYGSEDESLTGSRVDRRWLQTFGVTAGTVAEDWLDDELTAKQLAPLLTPPDELLAERDLHVLFLGYYFAWDPKKSLAAAVAHGFQSRPEGARVGHYDFVNIDDDMISVHHHPKWHKFGITRTWDTLSMEIRNGRMTRDDAIEHLRRVGDETPWADIRVFSDYLGIEVADYFEILEGFRNHDIWSRRDGRWCIDGFLIPEFEWPEDPFPEVGR